MQRTPTKTSIITNYIRESNLKPTYSNPTTQIEKKRKFNESEMTSPKHSESEKNSTEMMKRFEGLELQLKTLNETIKQLNEIIGELRKENRDLKQMIQESEAEEIAPKSQQTHTEQSNATKPSAIAGNNNNKSDDSDGSGNGSGSGSNGSTSSSSGVAKTATTI